MLAESRVEAMGSNGAASNTEASRTSSSLSSPGFEAMHHRGHNEIMANNYMSEGDELEIELPGENGQGGTEQQKLRPNEDGVADEAAAMLTKHDFLVSFLVDARGGSLKGCRYSGVKVSILQFRILLFRIKSFID